MPIITINTESLTLNRRKGDLIVIDGQVMKYPDVQGGIRTPESITGDSIVFGLKYQKNDTTYRLNKKAGGTDAGAYGKAADADCTLTTPSEGKYRITIPVSESAALKAQDYYYNIEWFEDDLAANKRTIVKNKIFSLDE